MTDEKISSDTFSSCLRQLIINCEPIIRDADSIQTVQESLQRLEENDENFYKYELVKLLKLQLNDKLGSYIDETIEQYPANRVDLNHAEMIDNMISKLIYSTEYLKLSKKLKTMVTNANDYLLSKYEIEIENKFKQQTNNKTNRITNSNMNWYDSKNTQSGGSHNVSTTFKQSQQEAQAIFNDNYLFSIQSSDGESCSSSFLNPESCVFLNQGELAVLAEELDGKKKSFAKRQETLIKLLKIPVVDIHCWDVLGPGLIDSINDPDLFNLAIKFVIKGFISTPSNIKALYGILVKQLELVFSSKKYLLPTLRSGIDIRRQDIQRILISLRLINEFQQNVIHFWVRYSEKFLEDIMECTLKLFSINYKSLSLDSKPTPLHFLSLIDPKAEWMTKWMHGTYSRIPLMRFLEKYKSILEDSITCCLRYFAVYSDPESKSNAIRIAAGSELSDSTLLYSASQIDYLYFIHSLNVVMRTMMYTSYRHILNDALQHNSHTISSFMTGLLCFWFKTPECAVNSYTDLDPHVICYSIIRTVVQDKKACKYCFCNTEFLAEIFRFLLPLKNLTGDDLSKYLSKYEDTLCYLCDTLATMIQYKKLRIMFLCNFQKVLMPQSAIELFGELIHRNLSENQSLSPRLITKLVSIVCQFYSGCVELPLIWSLNIHSELVQAWKNAEDNKDRCTTPTKDKSTRKIFQIISWADSLSSNLLWLTKTLRGVMFLEKHDALSVCLDRLLAKGKMSQLQGDRLPIGNIDLLINQIASTQSGIKAILSVGIIQRLLMEIWSLTECDPDDLPTYQGCIWPVQSMNITCLKPLVKLIAIHSSYFAFYSMIADQNLPTEDHYSFREIPKTLIAFIDRLVIINKSSKIHGLFNFESSHLCGLCWLSATVSNLNCLLLLESQYKFIDCLIQAQKENRSGNSDCVIIDALSVERNNIILKSSFLAGPSERILITQRLIDLNEKDIITLKLSTEISCQNYFRCPQSLENNETASSLQSIIRDYSIRNSPVNISLEELKSSYLEELKSGAVSTYSLSEITTLLEFVITEKIKLQPRTADGCFSYVDKIGKFSKFEKLGIQMIVEYGKNLKLFAEEDIDSINTDLKLVLTNTKLWMKDNFQFDLSKHESLGFDWFSGCFFLLCKGNGKKCVELLSKFIQLDESILLWPFKASLNVNGNPLMMIICHWIETIITTECPAVHSSFQICGYPITEVCSLWFSQCFLNIFNWSNIAIFIASNIVLGPTFSIYFALALLKYLEPIIKAKLHNNDLIILIREIVIDEINMHDTIEEIVRYQSKYDGLIKSDMKLIFDGILK